MEEGRKYIFRYDFFVCSRGAYDYAKRTGLLEKMDWFIEVTPEYRKWMSSVYASIYHLIVSAGLECTKQWLFLESGKEDVYTKDQRKLLLSWSEKVNENWVSWKKLKWWSN